jgi:myo-inositol-1(or 4)-monophosphatase
MAASGDRNSALEADWLEVSRSAARAVRSAVDAHPDLADRARVTGRGEGGDDSLVIDSAAEDAVLAELEKLALPLTVISEEMGRVEIAGGGPVTVVVDPVDGSLNAKRDLPLWALSIAVASGPTMADVEFGYVANPDTGEEWWAQRSEGAYGGGTRLDAPARGSRLEFLGVESAHPPLVSAAAGALAGSGAHRLRMIGSVALSLCLVADGRFDAMLSLRDVRSVDAAAGQLIVREAGGAVAFPAAGDRAAPLDLEMRSRVFAGRTASLLETALAIGPRPSRGR